MPRRKTSPPKTEAKKSKVDKVLTVKAHEPCSTNNVSTSHKTSASLVENVDLNESATSFDNSSTNSSFETLVASLSEEVMNGSQPLPNETVKAHEPCSTNNVSTSHKTSASLVENVDLNESATSFDNSSTNSSFETLVASLSEEVMNGSQPLPNEENYLAELGLKLQNIPEIFENIFSCVAGSDMLCRCSMVCHSWNNLIKNKQFMQWKKLYMKMRSNDKAAYDQMKSLLNSVFKDEQSDGDQRRMSDAVTTIIRFAHYSKSSSIVAYDDKKTLESLSNHSLYDFAMNVVKKKVASSNFTFDAEGCCWMVAAAIACLSASTSRLTELRRCLLQVHSLHVVMDFFYLVAVCTWFMFKEKRLSQELHYRIFCSIASVENTTFPKPGNAGGVSLTYEQCRVVSHPLHQGDVIRIVAYAGTGKTTTLASCVGANPNKTFLYTSFAKSVVVQGAEVFGSFENVKCRTLHSLAYWGMNMRNYPNKYLRGGSFRSSDIREKLKISSEDKQLPSLVIRCVNKFLSSSDSGFAFRHVPMRQRNAEGEYEELDPSRRKEILNLAKSFYQKTCDVSDDEWKMTDDCYLKQWQLTRPIIDEYDVIMLDEAQDCTDCMKELLERQRDHCTLLLVGDSHQQIYGFRYASDALITISPTHSYYLTQSFRFGEEIAQVSDVILRSLKFDRPHRNPDVVADKTLLGVGRPGHVSGVKSGNQVATLCRSNRGVIKRVLQLMKANPKRKVAVVGGVFKLGLDLLMDLYALTMPIMKRTGRFRIKRRHLQRYENLRELEVESMMAEDEETLNKIGIVRDLGEGLPKAVETLQALPDRLNEADHVVSTMHKAKGLEFDTVVIWDDFASNLVVKLERGVQLRKYDEGEANLLYVAATRAKRSLIMSSVLCKVLQLCKIHFLRPLPTSSLLESKDKVFCACCKKIISPHSVLTFHQPSILKMQEEGFLCSSCGSSISPGWEQLLMDPSTGTTTPS